MAALLNIFIATSLDGYIAKEDGDIDWLSLVERPGEDYGYSAFVKEMSTVIMGRKTYEKVLEFGVLFPHRERKTYVISHSKKGADENVEFFGGDLKPFITRLKAESEKGIFCDGGAQLIDELIREDLVDRYIISMLPILLGGGIPMFKGGRPEQKLTLTNTRCYGSGLIQLEYIRNPNLI